MDDYNKIFLEETAYLEKTIAIIKKELKFESDGLFKMRGELIAARREMWENTSHYTDDFEKLTEVIQHLSEVTNQSAVYSSSFNRVEKYKKMLNSPYFGRFDFKEKGYEGCDRIYVGLFNLTDSDTNDIYVYDWRAPISSIFYRFESGSASYSAPFGEITGDVLLKRQYKIQQSALKYFFDCSIRINDEILQEVLCQNSSVKMRSIVETIQKEQDIIIRDTENELLIVQGVAGSGKTSIALHRIAFLLYQGIGGTLNSSNIIIISPNSIFSKYISSVLPELGEENVGQVTVDELFNICIGDNVKHETRNMQLEAIITCSNTAEKDFMKQCIEFKGSSTFASILDRLLMFYEHRLLKFEDVYYDGKIIENRQQLKSDFLNNKTGMPMAKRLKRIENRILDRIHPLQRERYKKIEKIVQHSEGHNLEIKSFSRLLSIKQTLTLVKHLYKFTVVDPFAIYRMLFDDRKLLYTLACGLDLPGCIEQIISSTAQNLQKEHFCHEDSAPLIYLKLKMEGTNLFHETKQVIIDEAQDYYPIHYKIFKLLFKDCKFTVLGDIYQTIEKDAQISIYDDVVTTLDKKKSMKLILNKSYRASYEINAFTQSLLSDGQGFVSFERHETEPVLVYTETRESLDSLLLDDISNCLDKGFETIAVLCKTSDKAGELYSRLKGFRNVKLLDTDKDEVEKGVMIMPVYMSKGLEFDAVYVYDTDMENYTDRLDRKLLYIACTRALHILKLYHIGEKSPLIPYNYKSGETVF